MIVDSSAIVAIILKEPGYSEILYKLISAEEAGIGTPTLVECGIVLTARLGSDARGFLARFLEETNIVTIPFTDAHVSVATGSWIKYGKGRHAAGLNFGDCLTYAVAKLANMPLLFVGDDFQQTDLQLA